MEKYDNIGLVGEGSYGIVMKCRHKSSGTLVAIKKFLESEDDKIVRRIANREIKMLKQLRHENLVSLIDVFRRRKKLYLVFEFVDYTLLDDLENNPGGLEDKYAKRILFQVLRGIEFCHNNDIIHRDIKPENILVSKTGVVKLCDFGFARPIIGQDKSFTDYVATRWYRAPELLVGDTRYGKPVDIWAVGCLTSEMYTGDPLFPGDSDIDQLFHIVRCIGPICSKHVEIFRKNSIFKGLQLPQAYAPNSIEKRYPKIPKEIISIILKCLDMNPDQRPSCTDLLAMSLFGSRFSESLIEEIRNKVHKEHERNPLVKSIQSQNSVPHSKLDTHTSKTSNYALSKPSYPYKPPVQKPAAAASKSTNSPPKQPELNQSTSLNYKLKQEFIDTKTRHPESNLNRSNHQEKHDDGPAPVTDELMKIPPIDNTKDNENLMHKDTDDDGWADVRPLTSRRERVASRAGRVGKLPSDVGASEVDHDKEPGEDKTSPPKSSTTSRPCTAVAKNPSLSSASIHLHDNEPSLNIVGSSTPLQMKGETDGNAAGTNETDGEVVLINSDQVIIGNEKIPNSHFDNTSNKSILKPNNTNNRSSPILLSESINIPPRKTFNPPQTSSNAPSTTKIQSQNISPSPTSTYYTQHIYTTNTQLNTNNKITGNNPSNAGSKRTMVGINSDHINNSYLPNIKKDENRLKSNVFKFSNPATSSSNVLKNYHSFNAKPHAHQVSHYPYQSFRSGVLPGNLYNTNNNLETNNNGKTTTGLYHKKKPVQALRTTNPMHISTNHDNVNAVVLPELKGAEMQILRNHGPINNPRFKCMSPNRTSNFHHTSNTTQDI